MLSVSYHPLLYLTLSTPSLLIACSQASKAAMFACPKALLGLVSQSPETAISTCLLPHWIMVQFSHVAALARAHADPSRQTWGCGVKLTGSSSASAVKSFLVWSLGQSDDRKEVRAEYEGTKIVAPDSAGIQLFPSQLNNSLHFTTQ